MEVSNKVRRLVARVLASSLARGRLLADGTRAQALTWTVPGLHLGRDVRIGPHADVRAFDGGTITIGDRVVIADGVVLHARGGHLAIGSDTYLGRGAQVVATRAISIGSDCLLAQGATILDVEHEYSAPDILIRMQGRRSAAVTIGGNVWLGTRVVVTAGTRIGSGAVVGAHTVVTKDVPAGVVFAGVPGSVVRETRDFRPALR